MDYEPVGKRRSKVNQLGDRIEIIIPSKKRIFSTVFIGFWLIAWLFGMVMVTTVLFGDYLGLNVNQVNNSTPQQSNAFLIFWLCGWTVGGAIAIYTFLWLIVGKERIVIASDGIAISKEVLFFKRTKKYDLNNCRNLKLSFDRGKAGLFSSMAHPMEYWQGGSGIITFDYGAKDVKFGIGMDEAEANMIIDEIKHHFR